MGHADETSAQYLFRVLHSRQSKMQDLRAALSSDNAVKSIFRQNRDNPMTLQYDRVFDELQAIVAANSSDASTDGPAKPPGRIWPDRPVADAIPEHRAGWVRQIGAGLAFWGKYLFESPSGQAGMRVKYLEARIDAKVNNLQRALALGTNFDRNKARIESRLRDLHDAVDDLHTELSLQNSSRSSDDYMQDALLRSLGGYNTKTLSKLWHALPEDQWEPFVMPPRTTRLGQIARRIVKPFSNPFHDRLRYQAEMEKRAPLQGRVAATWTALLHMIEEEPDVRDFNLALRRLATHLDKKAFEEKDYDAISDALGQLIKLDAQRGANRDIRTAAFKPALKRLPLAARSLLMKRLEKYSSQSGEGMIGFVKTERLSKKVIAPEDRWLYAKLLEELYAAGRELNFVVLTDTAPATASQDAEQPQSIRKHESGEKASLLPAATDLAIAAVKTPARGAAARLLPLTSRLWG